MTAIFEHVREDLPSQPFAKDIVSFIVFGSSVFDANCATKIDDIDVCVVVSDRTADLKAIADYIFASFEKPDYRIYFLDEVNSNLPFADKGIGEFALEYFAHGVSLYGENIFIEKLKTTSKRKLKESYLWKIFEYIVRIRETYYSKLCTEEYKKWHLNKYTVRLLIDILLYNDVVNYAEVKSIKPYEIVALAAEHAIVKHGTKLDFENREAMFALFLEINAYVVRTHSSLTKQIKTSIGAWQESTERYLKGVVSPLYHNN